MRPSPGPSASCALRVFAALSLALPAAGQDPFQPGLRWVLPPDPAAPAIPRAVAFAGSESIAWSTAAGAAPAFVATSAHAAGSAEVLGRQLADPSASGSIGIASGSGPWLFGLAQLPAPDAWHRRTRISGHHAADLALGAQFAPRWSRDLTFVANAPARIACDRAGARALVAAHDDALATVHVEALAADTGAALWTRALSAAGLQELVASAHAERVALSAGLDLWVLDAQGATVHHAALSASTTALAIAGDGRTLAHGAPGALRVLAEVGSTYALVRTLAARPQEMAVRAALSGDGATLALAWWNATSGTSWRFEAWDLAAGVRLFESAFSAPGGGLQNLPTAVALTPDGARAAFACWGEGGPAPEVGIWDRASASLVLQASLSGSAFGLALDDGGTRLLVAQKSTHANLLSGTGEVRLYDTGERALQLLGAARVGGQLNLAAQRAGASSVIFLDGEPSAAPILVPGVAGALLLRRTGLAVARVRADANGRADVALAIPADPLLIGTVRHFQAAFRVGPRLELAAPLLEPLVL